jgi:nucleotide-binding universal stress UspA family protein
MSATTRTEVFDRVVCGVDRSEAGAVAARAAAIVTDPAGSLTLVSANDSSIAVHAGWDMSHVLEELAADAAAALEQGEAEAQPLHELDAKIVEGDPLHALLGEIERRDATTIVVGSHGHARATGIALGSVATHLLHEAPCSVLVARGHVASGRWPRRLVVGVDGSEQGAHAYAAASQLAERLGAELRAVAATRDGGMDVEAARAIAPDLEEYESRALDLFSVFAGPSDLFVVGSRGLRGIRSLGSLSERLAHESRSSVLVVRRRA